MVKIKLSVEYIFQKVASLFLVFVSLQFLFAGELVYIFFLPVFAYAATYFFTLPRVHHDKANLYVKRAMKPEISILLSNITSLAHSRSVGGNGGAYRLSIKYNDEVNNTCEIKCYAKRQTEKIKKFFALVQKRNPQVEIL